MRKVNSKEMNVFHKYQPVLVLVFVVVVLVMIFKFPSEKNPPLGLPNSYYSSISRVEESDYEVYVYSNLINFNNELKVKNTSVLFVTPPIEDKEVFLIVDMLKFENSEYDEAILTDIFENRFVNLIIVNLTKTEIKYSTEFLEENEASSDLIFCYWETDEVSAVEYYANSFESQLLLDYSILKTMNDYIRGY